MYDSMYNQAPGCIESQEARNTQTYVLSIVEIVATSGDLARSSMRDNSVQ